MAKKRYYLQDTKERRPELALGNLCRGNRRILQTSSGLLVYQKTRTLIREDSVPRGTWMVVVRKDLEVWMEPRVRVRIVGPGRGSQERRSRRMQIERIGVSV